MEQEADIDSLLEGVELDGETPEPTAAPKADAKPGEPAAKPDDKGSDKNAEKIDARIQSVLKKHLPNPEAACLMVDILCPGEAIVAMKADFNLSPRNHFLLAAGGILMVALATNPEIVQRLRAGLNRKRQPPQPRPTTQKKLPAPAPAPRPADPVDAAVDAVELEA